MTDYQLPAKLDDASHLGQRQRPLNEASTQGLGFPQPPHISRLNGRFFFVGEDGEYLPVATFDPAIGNYLDVVIVDVNEKKSKLYFDKTVPYDKDSGAPPLCFSDNGSAPSINAIQPQAQFCNQCPQNIKGSALGLNNKPVWACKDYKKIAVLANGQPGVWQFMVPAASLTNWRNYCDWAKKQALPGASRNADIADLITRINFVPGDPNVIEFRYVGIITKEIAALQDKLLESKQTDSIVGRDDQPRQSALPVPRAAQPVASSAATVSAPPLPPLPAPTGFSVPAAGSLQQVAPKPAGPMTPDPAAGASVIPFGVPGAVTPPTASPQTPAVSGASPSKRSRGRPRATPVTSTQQPAFLDPSQNPNAPPPPQPAPVQFGIAQPQPAPANLQSELEAAFKL